MLGIVFQAKGTTCANAPSCEEPDEQEVREAGNVRAGVETMRGSLL